MSTWSGSSYRIGVHDPETLRERWKVASGGNGEMVACGPVLCLNTDAGSSGHDPVTGRELWRHAGAQVTGLGDGPVGLWNDAPGGNRHALVELGSGRILAPMAPRIEVSGTNGAYLMSPSVEPGGRTAISEARDGRVGLLGTVAEVPWPQQCQAAGGALVCPSEARTELIGVTVRRPGE